MTSSWEPSNFRNRSVAVIGAGVLGRRIGCVWAAAGFKVRFRDPNEQQRADALQYVKENIAAYAKETGKKPSEDVQALESLKDAVQDAWLVVEAVPERIQMKIDIFAELEKLAPVDCILATNSSSYKSSEMLEKVSDETKKRILNTHYYMPPNCMVVELMTDGHTRQDIFPFLVQQAKESACVPYVARKESTGLIFNRIWAAVKREVLTVLADGVSVPEEIDALWREMFRSPSGPCRMMDSVGLDTVSFIETHYVTERGLSPAKTVDFLEANYIKNHKLGAKSNLGGLYPHEEKAADDAKSLYVLDLGLAVPTVGPTSGRILKYSMEGHLEKVLVEGQFFPDGLAIDATENKMFWTNMGVPGKQTGTINSANLDGSDVRTIVSSGKINTPKQMALDKTAKKIYFSDREGLRVYRCDYNGSGLEAIVVSGNPEDAKVAGDATNWCVGIAVVPSKGKFYWTQKGPSKGGKGRIFSANIALPAGATVESRPDIECLLKGLPEPIDLEFDESSDMLYWTDRGELPLGNSLNRIQLDKAGAVATSAKSELLARNFNEAIGLALDKEGSSVYVTDLGGSIYRFGLDGTGKKRVFGQDTCSLSGIAINCGVNHIR